MRKLSDISRNVDSRKLSFTLNCHENSDFHQYFRGNFEKIWYFLDNVRFSNIVNHVMSWLPFPLCPVLGDLSSPTCLVERLVAGPLGQYKRDKSIWTGQPDRSRTDWAWTVQRGQDCSYVTAKTEQKCQESTGEACWGRRAGTGHLGLNNGGSAVPSRVFSEFRLYGIPHVFF